MAIRRLIRGAGHRIREERELRAGAAWKGDAVQLRRVAKPRADDHLATRRVPVPERGRSEVTITPRAFGDGSGYGRNPVGHEILGRRAALSERGSRGEQGDQKQQTHQRRHSGSSGWLSLEKATAV